ncbi:NUDIX hydrolase [Crenobacter cavernae]|uniref:NUDIX domain-containing protein n=1 Tax=Crenobacter cavernae TaxID=2290923 RepID=A0A345Y4C0_9NEIS|nr:NUDIX domain-containing protein [Crenobacter cavernae]AXK38772.1 NUDIX domain-containing protein [Crenobacter cavernae]
MAFDDRFRLSAHAVITDAAGAVLQLKANYGDFGWGLPGGALDPGETIHEALLRECREELGVDVAVQQLTGVYYHAVYASQVFIFRCTLPDGACLLLSDEHSAWRYFSLSELSAVQRHRIDDCLGYDGTVRSARF